MTEKTDPKTERLYWLGRYIERTYTTIRAVKILAEDYVQGEEAEYVEYCRRLGIPNVYKNTEDFMLRYLFDESSSCSVISCLHRACRNARLLGDVIPDETLAYIRMARQAMETAANSPAAEIELQWVLDDIMAFRGSCCENVENRIDRNVINTGTSIERLTLYLRLGHEAELRRKELGKLLNRLYKSQLTVNQAVRNRLIDHVLDKEQPTISVSEQLQCVETLLAEL